MKLDLFLERKKEKKIEIKGRKGDDKDRQADLS